jgi:hypothetical protein
LIMIKKILVAVLAVAAFGLPARASVVPYCNSYCGGNTTAAFASVVGLDGYTYASGTDLTFTGGLSDGGLQYLDGATSVLFAASSALTITVSDVLELAANKAITISVPAGYGAVQLFLSQTGVVGSAFTCIDTSCDDTYLTSTPIELDYLNTTPGSAWNITITPGLSSEQIIVDSFNPAGTSQGSSGGDTPEVGTLLLIGSGLIGMRWMKGLPRRFFGTPQTA